jgi:hypothetical protein
MCFYAASIDYSNMKLNYPNIEAPNNYTKEEFKILLLNKFAAKKNHIDDFLNELVEFLTLKSLANNELENIELEEIINTLALGIGSIDQALEDLIIFRQKLFDEKELENL